MEGRQQAIQQAAQRRADRVHLHNAGLKMRRHDERLHQKAEFFGLCRGLGRKVMGLRRERLLT